MIIDLGKAAIGPSLDTQVCVVGAGAVGLSLALALRSRGIDVLLLEGGGESLESKSQDLQKGESIGHRFSSIDVGRYRVLGGTTTMWGGQVLPFDSFVTEARPWLAHSAWPIATPELARYFARTYQHLGLADRLLDDEDVWAALSAPVPDLGEGLQLILTRWMKTRNFAKLYRTDIRGKDGPVVVLHANVTALNVQHDGNVTSVHAQSLEGRKLTVRASKFVLANGTLEIARLLKHPLRDGSAAPWADSPWLGSPLIDHLDCNAGNVEITDHKRFHEIFDSIFIRGRKYYPKIRAAQATQRSKEMVDIAAQFVYRTRLSDHIEYVRMFFRSLLDGGRDVSFLQLPGHLSSIATTAAPLALRYFRDRRSFKPSSSEVGLFFFCEQMPTTRSRIELTDDRDVLGMRKLRVDWQIDGRELRTMRDFGHQIQRQLGIRQLARVSLDPRLEDADPAFFDGVSDAIHHMGTARMGASAGEGVVDPRLLVYGTTNLFIAGAATFPSTGFANPTFTAIALALRLADHLTESLRGSP